MYSNASKLDVVEIALLDDKLSNTQLEHEYSKCSQWAPEVSNFLGFHDNLSADFSSTKTRLQTFGRPTNSVVSNQFLNA